MKAVPFASLGLGSDMTFVVNLAIILALGVAVWWGGASVGGVR